jgi:hypothetical protein
VAREGGAPVPPSAASDRPIPRLTLRINFDQNRAIGAGKTVVSGGRGRHILPRAARPAPTRPNFDQFLIQATEKT